MGLIVSFIALIALFLPLVYCNYQQDKECERVKVKVYIDVTLDAYARQQCLQILKGYTDLPEGSEVELTTVNSQILEKLGTFKLPEQKESLLATLSGNLQTSRLVKSSDAEVKMSSKFLADDVISYFGFGKFKTEAELVLFFVSSSSQLDMDSNFIRKKKTLVVVLGHDGNPDWKAVASDMDHYFHVSREENIYDIIEGLISITCKDSKFTCDTDEFRTSRGSVCKKCVKYYCERMDSLTCAHRCPYYRKPAADSNTQINSATNNPDVEGSADHKPETLTAVLVLSVVLTPLLAIFLYKTFNNGQTIIHHDIEMMDLSRRNTNQESPNLEESRVLISDRAPQEEPPGGAIGVHPEHRPTDEEMGDQPALSRRNINQGSPNLEENRVLIPGRAPQQEPSGGSTGVHPEDGPTDEEMGDQPDLSPRNINQESPNLEENRVLIPGRAPQQEPSGGSTGVHPEDGPTDEEMGDQPDLSPRNINQGSPNLEENRASIPGRVPQQGPSGAIGGYPEPRQPDEEPLLKNGQELEKNILTFDGPSFIDVQEGKRAAVSPPVNAAD